MIVGEMVDKIRRNLGKQLAKEHPLDRVLKNGNSEKKPIIISVPDSSNTAAIGYAHENQKLGFDCKYDIGFLGNHLVGVPFKSPGQKSGEQKGVRKYITQKVVLGGGPVLMFADPMFLGTTSRYLF